MSCYRKSLKKSFFLPVLIIATIAIGLYSNSLKNGFVYDDKDTILNNTLIKSFDNIPLLFDKIAYFRRSEEVSYRPVVTFTYFIDDALYGLRPWGYHLTNILLHAINGALLYFFLTLLLTPHVSRFTSPAFLISLLFVTHPVLTETVNCISYREDLLVFLFYIATLSIYFGLRHPTSNQRPLVTVFLYFLSCLAYLFALLSKEMAATLPLTIFCYECLYGREKVAAAPCAADNRATLDSAATKIYDNIPFRVFNRYSIGYITITLFYLYLRFYLFHNPEEQIEAWRLVERFLTLPWLIISYMKLSLFPVQLSADYVINPTSSSFTAIFILPIIAFVSIITIIVILGNRERSILFGALFFLITLIPVYNIVPIANPLAERYLYLPVVGSVLFAVMFTYLIAEKFKIRLEYRNYCVAIFFLLVSTVFSLSVVKRNTIWRDGYSLWSDTVAKMPNSSQAHNNLGVVYFKQGRYDEAIGEFLKALKLRFDNELAHYNLGLEYLRQDRYGEAIYELKTALRFKPDYADAYNNLGIIYFRQGLFDQAIKEYLTAIRLKPDDAMVHYNVGVVFFKQSRYDKAIYELKTALRYKPDYADAYYNLGNTYARQGQFDQAIKEYLASIRLKPEYTDAYNNLGIAYARQGLLDQAIKKLLTAIRLKPDDARTHYNLASIYLEQGRYDEAIYEFTATLKLKPDFKEAYSNLEVLMKKRRVIKDTGNATVGRKR